MKVGTDGVLIGCWTEALNPQYILDLGTGSGLIALMMAQRYPQVTRIDAIDPDADCCSIARKNISNSPWPTKITVHETSLQDYHPEIGYHLIVSNPPYFQNSLLPPSQSRQTARHTNTLSFTELAAGAAQLLAENGVFALILPAQEADKFISIALTYQLYIYRECRFYTRSHKPVERKLLQFKRQPEVCTFQELVLYKGSTPEWSSEYTELTREFYLNNLL